MAVNVQGTLNLLEFTVAAGVDRFVLTSTTSLIRESATWVIETHRKDGKPLPAPSKQVQLV